MEINILIIGLSVIINLLCVSVYTKYFVYTHESEIPDSIIERVFFPAVIGICIGVGLPIIMAMFTYQYDSMVTGILLIGIFYLIIPYVVSELTYNRVKK